MRDHIKINPVTLARVQEILRANPTTTIQQLKDAIGFGYDSARLYLKHAKDLQISPTVERISGDQSETVIADKILKILQRGPITPASLCSALNIDLTTFERACARLSETHEIEHHGALLSIGRPPVGRIDVDIIDPPDWTNVGLVSDTHLACKEERLDALHAVYDIFAREGITRVFHAGNIVDGYIPKINGESAICTTIDDQIQYVIDQYPRREGITTHYITGDDHEGWWIKTGYNFGRDLMQTAQGQGRTDLIYIGHIESDVEFKGQGGSAIMKVQHPGGGSAYASSYAAQKQVESFQGGEKPALLIQGHYHRATWIFERNVHVVGMPGFQDQTVFGRKKRLRFEIGGAILRFKQNTHDGAITRCAVEFIMFFDRGYYRPYLRSDAAKPHTVIQSSEGRVTTSPLKI